MEKRLRNNKVWIDDESNKETKEGLIELAQTLKITLDELITKIIK